MGLAAVLAADDAVDLHVTSSLAAGKANCSRVGTTMDVSVLSDTPGA
jgi:aspartate oxidase